MEENIIKINKVSMSFKLTRDKIFSLKEYVIKFLKQELEYEEFKALTDISFELKKGEILGIIGFNGSGKSTMLKIISGIMKPTKGSVEVNGNISPLIELGSGFDMELTARENIFLNGYILGYSKKFLRKHFDEIIEFSELGEFIDIPVKNFSSGMIARLGFAIATTVNPEILIVDEILSVGDFKFQKKSEDRIKEMIKNGVTVIIVSHSIEQIEELCTKVLWLDKGRVKDYGETNRICKEYKNS
ncbi:ABC transporter ATP-binding protein [Leptotrichia sp. oral taxon 879]|uniref:ABC transporter ATP-binding protein n=1 Tax=Leptotrichia mesophila TaxID=3239303 RepID=A0AB39VBA9_9FUSO|nr:ABC transporter ATP-binding protein [Leptotrichia sp. oral taxon 879]ERK52110.1 putative O-antigen export system ATP-binding protein RfbB [Leptotrichia sp. oral taxon 879 str. F0557]